MSRFFDPEFNATQTALIRSMERAEWHRKNPDLEAARRVSDLCAPSAPEAFEPPDEVQQPEVVELHPVTAALLWDAAQEGIRALG